MVVMMMMSSGMKMKMDEAQALARSCASRPDFVPCDGSVCATHSHGKCFRLHWCCCLGWCHCKYVYQPMTSVGQLPSTAIPAAPTFYTDTIDLTISLTERFLRIAPCFRPPLYPESPRYCNIAELFIDDYIVKRINGKMCYVQRPPPLTDAPPNPPPLAPPPQTHPANPHQRDAQTGQHSVDSVKQDAGARHHQTEHVDKDTVEGPKMDHCSSPSSSEDSGINTVGGTYLESCEEESEEEEDELSEERVSSPSSLWEQDGCALLSPSRSTVEIIENIETTV
ncbi:UPF0524 protein C3orf70 homolog B [Colossoma macropomum]|uniref:UPF0524 protein C3orf70 homolog B n=1 Tax=Colossoma macropomum TaxID=42526 RepID=UPI001864EDF0|nr:UPF0524 protein C3orf70 homolog B [Colossoma macropomum]